MSDVAERLDAAEVALRTLLKSGQIETADFFKSLIQLAHGWVALGNNERASNLIGYLTPEFVDSELGAMMAADPAFKAQAVAVGAVVGGEADEGEVEIEFALLTKKPAAA